MLLQNGTNLFDNNKLMVASNYLYETQLQGFTHIFGEKLELEY